MTPSTYQVLFQTCEYTFRENLDGLTDENSVRQPIEGASTFNWVVGHIVRTRPFLHQLLGQESPIDENTLDLYRAETPWDPSAATPFTRLIELYTASNAMLAEGFAALDEEVLDRKLPFRFGGVRRTLREMIGIIYHHESYHTGQLGVLRRALGLPGKVKPPND